MVAVVLAGGHDQIALIQELKERGFDVVLIDYFEDPPAKSYADIHYQTSTLDVVGVKGIAKLEKADLIATACTDQALLTVAKLSEELGLPSYLSYETVLAVTNKIFMKELMVTGGIPTTEYAVVTDVDQLRFLKLDYPVVVKPSDCNSSKGVKKAYDNQQVEENLKEALKLSRSSTAIVEEYFEGRELSVDAFIIGGTADILLITESVKVKGSNGFTIVQSKYPVNLESKISKKIELIIQAIARLFQISRGPLLVQLIVSDNDLSVIELSARMGGGTKYKLIETLSGFDIMKAYVDLITGLDPKVTHTQCHRYARLNYCYAYPGIFAGLDGFVELKDEGVIYDYYKYKVEGSVLEKSETSSDRVAGYLIIASTEKELVEKERMANKSLKIINTRGQDIMRHDLIGQKA